MHLFEELIIQIRFQKTYLDPAAVNYFSVYVLIFNPRSLASHNQIGSESEVVNDSNL